MGTRGVIIVKEGGRQVTLYQHHDGDRLPETLRAALFRAAKGHRLNDGPYLARIIFCEMVKGEEDGTSGFGIMQDPPGDESVSVTLDVDAQTVTVDDGPPVLLDDFMGQEPPPTFSR